MKKYLTLTFVLLMILSFANTTKAQIPETNTTTSTEQTKTEELKTEDPIKGETKESETEKTEEEKIENSSSTPITKEEIRLMKIEQIKEKSEALRAETKEKREEIKAEMKEKVEAVKAQREEIVKEVKEKNEESRINARLMVLNSFEVRINAFSQITKRLISRIEKEENAQKEEKLSQTNTILKSLEDLKQEIKNLKDSSSEKTTEEIRTEMQKIKDSLLETHKILTTIISNLKNN